MRTLMIRTTSIGEVMVLLQFFHEDTENRKKVLDHILESFPDITSLLYVINSKANDTLYDQEIICYAGRDHIFEQMKDLRFKITAKSFYQTNSEQAYNLYKVVEEFAGLQGDDGLVSTPGLVLALASLLGPGFRRRGYGRLAAEGRR